MNQKTLMIGDKQVFLAEPYRPRVISELVGRTQEMELITAGWMRGAGSLPLSPLLIGEPGVGKNRIIYEIARRTGKPLFIFQGHEDVTAEDLAFVVRFSDDVNRKMDYVASPLVTAMLQGGICFIDEIAKIRPRALALLVSVLDERRNIYSTLLAETITANDGFRFIAATNTADLEGNALPEFLRSRLRPIVEVGPPARTEIEDIIRAHHPALHDKVGPLIDTFWELWLARHKDGKHPPSARDVIYVFNLALSLADFEMSDGGGRLGHATTERPFALDSSRDATILKAEHVARAFGELFHA